ncbi:MAG: c-type cytochrome [Bryobacterales bacterium]|nr:c-type cytochrome [Bryobacterales bacterium]
MCKRPEIALIAAVALLWGCSSESKPPYSAEESMAMVELPAGYRLELVASEPDIVDPVAINFDEKGRMYVVEMIDYPLNLDPLGQVKRLEDKDGDGRFETVTTFADKIQFPTGVMRWRNGILVTSAPDLLYFEDADDDGVADKREVMLTGFAATNPQLRVNGPRYGIDNWIYINYPRLVNARKFAKEFGDGGSPLTFPNHPGAPTLDIRAEDIRIRPDHAKVEALGNGSQFGNSFDRWGNRFTVYNNDYLRNIVIEDRYLASNPYLAVTKSYRSVSGLDHAAEIYPVTVDPLVIHDSQIGHFTSACGMSIYTGGILPDNFEGNSLTCEPVNNLIRRSIVKPEGASFLAEPAYDHKEFLASKDSWFRPVFTTTGPDGAVYIADYYRFTVEHPEFVPPELSKQIEFEARHKLGRIYRLTHDGSKPWPKVDLSQASTAELVKNLEHPGSWQRLESQRLLMDRRDKAAVEPLLAMAKQSANSVARVHALWSLDGLGALDDALILAALSDPEPEARRQAVRMAETRLPDPALAKALLAMSDEKSSRVQAQLVMTLSLEGAGVATKDSFPLARKIVAEHMEDEWFRIAALTGAADDAGLWFASLTGDSALMASRSDGKADLLRRTAAILGAKQDVAAMTKALQTVQRAGKPEQSWWRVAALEGLGQGVDQAASKGLKLGPAQPVLLDILANADPAVAQAALELAWRAQLAPGPAVDRLIAAKTKTAFDTDADVAQRAAAAGVLGLRVDQGAAQDLVKLLAPQQPAEVQKAAMQAIATGKDPTLTPMLLERWRELPAPVRAIALGWFMNDRDRILALLNAVGDGAIQAWSLGPNAARVLERHPDAEIKKRAGEVLVSTEAADRQKVYEDYLAAVRENGDAGRGREVFRAQCSECHKVEDMGFALGPDLYSVTTRYKEVLLADILMPNTAVETGYEEYMVETKDGRMITGVLAKETPASVTIRQAKGVEDNVLRSNIEKMYSLSVSPMPEGFEDEISVDQMADLIAFIKSLRS